MCNSFIKHDLSFTVGSADAHNRVKYHVCLSIHFYSFLNVWSLLPFLYSLMCAVFRLTNNDDLVTLRFLLPQKMLWSPRWTWTTWQWWWPRTVCDVKVMTPEWYLRIPGRRWALSGHSYRPWTRASWKELFDWLPSSCGFIYLWCYKPGFCHVFCFQWKWLLFFLKHQIVLIWKKRAFVCSQNLSWKLLC